MMKILYSVQATGNGHISRAQYVIPYLQKFGEVDTLLSGSNSTLKPNFEVKYRSKGMSLFYIKCGAVDMKALLYKNNYAKTLKDAYDLPVKNYDIVVNDFDFVTALACKVRGKKSIQFGHQASFASRLCPRPDKKSNLGEFVLANYAKASHYVGLHFKPYDDFIFSPVIKPEITFSTPKDHGHITIYLPSFVEDCFKDAIKEMKHLKFEWFDKSIKKSQVDGNITFFPINNELFTNSLINCHGIITGGGFETPAEALFLEKRILAIPINGQYEQQCNAAALKKMGVPILNEINSETINQQIENWLNATWEAEKISANDLKKTVGFLFDNYQLK